MNEDKKTWKASKKEREAINEAATALMEKVSDTYFELQSLIKPNLAQFGVEILAEAARYLSVAEGYLIIFTSLYGANWNLEE